MSKIVQGYTATMIKGDFSLYEIKILVKIVERVQEYLGNGCAKNYIGQSICQDGINYNFSLTIRELIPEQSRHYEDVKEALIRLQEKKLTYFDTKKQIWYSSPLAYNCFVEFGTGIARFSASKWVIDTILDFSKGFTRYEFVSAMALSSPYSVRWYMLSSSLSRPLCYDIDFLKEWLGVSDKYKQTGDFLKRCVDPAVKELELQNVNGFSYEKIYKGNKIKSLRLIPRKREAVSTNELAAKVSASVWINPLLMNYLSLHCGFSSRELSAHKDLLHRFTKKPAWQDILMRIVERQRRGRFSKGYIINAIKGEVSNG